MKNFYKNEYLFSEIYLQEITQIEENPAVKARLSALKEYRDYADISNLAAWNESFVHEILKALRFGVRKVDENVALLYQLGSDSTITLCYSLLPSENLDSTTMGRNWAEKIIRNLRDNQLKWGILTNGDWWRIYHTEEPRPYENYLEIDLKGIMDGEDVQRYQIFNKFMRAENFVNNNDGNCQFDLFKKESHERINYIEEELKNALKQKEEGGKGILSNICMGYVDYLRENEGPDFSDESLRNSIYSSAMLYMFRLLCLFYAKARGLLKESNQELFSNVLLAAQKVQEWSDSGEDQYSLWSNLRELFSNIDLTYNGGLFNPAENQFVEEQRVSNTYLAPVIYYMTFYRDKSGSQKLISYRDMAVRHLGSLYEGLIEHKLFVSDEDTEVKVTKKEITFIPASKGGKIVKGKYIPTDQAYFGNDKGMRKASGSFYTPEYIVDYIVENTVGKRLQELKDAFIVDNKETIASIETAINKSEKDAFIDFLINNIDEFIQEKILNLSILDPAMGSAHFLVNVVDLISNFLTDFCNSFGIIAERDTSTTDWRRRVVENCIYGVDINPLAVELAKLSLWILSMVKDQPLSFLDHHLKCGNSLIGARLSDIGCLPNEKENNLRYTQQFGLFSDNKDFRFSVESVILKYKQIETKESNDLVDIGDKKQWLEEVKEQLTPYQAICNFHTNFILNDDSNEYTYTKTINSFSHNYNWVGPSYFHWELEFPEIMIDDNGFDIVIGNPPYIKEHTNRSAFIGLHKSQYYQGKMDIWTFFGCKAIEWTKTNGLISFIAPSNWISNYGASIFRNKVLSDVKIIKYIDFGDYKVFKNAGIQTMIYFFSKKKPESSYLFDYSKIENSKVLEINVELMLKRLQFEDLTNFMVKIEPNLESNNTITFLSDDIDRLTNKIQKKGQYRIRKENIGNGIDVLQDFVSEKHIPKLQGLNVKKGDGIFILCAEEIALLRLSDEEHQWLKPYYTPSQLNRYLSLNSESELKLIYANKIFRDNIEKYPNLKNHIGRFKPVLTSAYAPYGLHRPRDEIFFKGNVIFSLRKTVRPSFAYVTFSSYVTRSFLIIKAHDIDLEYLTAILNSKLICFWLKNKGKLQGNMLQIDKAPLENIPIVKADKNIELALKQMSEQMHQFNSDYYYLLKRIGIPSNASNSKSSLTNLREKIEDLDDKIDQMVYELYDMNPDEIKIIERGTELAK